jgi:hypothetical protein
LPLASAARRSYSFAGKRRDSLFSKASVEELRAILEAYRVVETASWPQLHPAMEKRSARWPLASEDELRAELQGYLDESCGGGNTVRVFWKLGPRYLFAGSNVLFARDAGLPAAELLGTDDFDSRLPWGPQAAKYRTDDTEVVTRNAPKLGILERQKSPSGTVIWVQVGKAPIRAANGSAIGLLGMYELIDDKTAQKLLFDRRQAGQREKP